MEALGPTPSVVFWPEHAGTQANDGRAVWAKHVMARNALVAATRLLADQGVPSLAVKGAVTAYMLYRDPAERPVSDVDLRIRPDDFRRSVRAFEQAGWSIRDWKPMYGAFVAELAGVCIDVESVVGAPGLCGLSIQEMLSRASERLAGTEVPVPEIHDHAVLLVVNVFKDKLLGAAPWAIEDVRRIVEVSEFDTARFAALAWRAKVAGIAWLVADWMVREHGSGGWSAVREKLGGRRGPRPVYAMLFRWLLKRTKPDGLVVRVTARLGADAADMWMGALGRAVAVEWGGLRARSRRNPT
jgi:hypothetical protein